MINSVSVALKINHKAVMKLHGRSMRNCGRPISGEFRSYKTLHVTVRSATYKLGATVSPKAEFSTSNCVTPANINLSIWQQCCVGLTL